jgi:hypothetical protein
MTRIAPFFGLISARMRLARAYGLLLTGVLYADFAYAGQGEPQCWREHSACYCFFQDQGGSLGAAATFAAVLVALFLPLYLERRSNRGRARNLIRSLRIEADRWRTLATDRLYVLNAHHDDALRTRDQRYESMKIFTIGSMREGPGMADLPHELNTSAQQLIAHVDKLNSLVEARGPLGALHEEEVRKALELIVKSADEILSKTNHR